MICYRDRAFCSAICETKQCDRNFSPEVKAKADEWWALFKSDRPCPIHFRDMSKGCSEYRPPVATHGAQALDSVPKHDKVM